MTKLNQQLACELERSWSNSQVQRGVLISSGVYWKTLTVVTTFSQFRLFEFIFQPEIPFLIDAPWFEIQLYLYFKNIQIISLRLNTTLLAIAIKSYSVQDKMPIMSFKKHLKISIFTLSENINHPSAPINLTVDYKYKFRYL